MKITSFTHYEDNILYTMLKLIISLNTAVQLYTTDVQ